MTRTDSSTRIGDVIRCPDCGEPPRFDGVTDGFGIGRCGCGEVPLAEHVLVPGQGDLREALLSSLRAGDKRAASALILGRHANKQRLLRALRARPTLRRFVRHQSLSTIVNTLRLRGLLQTLPPRRINDVIVAAAQWNDYIRHRFSLPSMLAGIPLLGLLKDREGLVLDAPCGMGHLSFLIGRLFPQERLVSMDVSAAFAYSTRRFFVPNAAATIAYDMNRRLPLADASFGVVFCADAFQYVDEQAQLAREFMRILRDDGVCVLAHVHNSLQHNAFAGNPRTPAEYARLFEPHPVRIFPDSALLDACLCDRPFDLSRRWDDRELDASPGLVVVAAKDPGSLVTLDPMRQRLIATARNPRVSGLYRIRRAAGEYVFERDIPPSLTADFPELLEYLTPYLSVPAGEVTHSNGALRFANAPELLEKHILVDLPEDY